MSSTPANGPAALVIPLGPAPAPESCNPGRTYNHDLLRKPKSQEMALADFPRVANVLIDQNMLAAFGPFEDKARVYKKLVKRIGSLAILLMVIAFSGAIAEVYGMATATSVLPHWATRAVEGCALTGLIGACLVARWGPLRHHWMLNRFCAEVLRAWHFRRVLSKGFVESVLSGNRQVAENGHRPLLNGLLLSFSQSGPVLVSQLIQLGTDPLGQNFAPTLPSDPAVADELLRAYDTLRVAHQDCFFHERANNLFADFAWCSNATWVTVVRALTGVTLALGLAASFLSLLVPDSVHWTPFVVTACTVAGIGVRSWGDGMRFEEEQDHYLLWY